MDPWRSSRRRGCGASPRSADPTVQAGRIPLRRGPRRRGRGTSPAARARRRDQVAWVWCAPRGGCQRWGAPFVPVGNMKRGSRPPLVPVYSTGTKGPSFCLSSSIPVGLKRPIPALTIYQQGLKVLSPPVFLLILIKIVAFKFTNRWQC
jgi:hypothetical protein